jgi:hypothetical protein
LPEPARRERAARLIALGRELGLAFHERYVGGTRPVLWESCAPALGERRLWSGYTDNFIRVTAPGPAGLGGKVTPATLGAARPNGMDGALPAGPPGEQRGADGVP